MVRNGPASHWRILRTVLLTPERRAERERERAKQLHRKPRKVHFRLPDARRETPLYRIYEETDPLVQGWRRFMLLPLNFELWAFPFRLALCFPSVSSGMWYADLACDSTFWIDALVALHTAGPADDNDAGAEVGAKEGMTTKSMRAIARHYFLFAFPLELLPSFLYLVASPLCAAYLPPECASAGPFPANITSPPRKEALGSVRPEYDLDQSRGPFSYGCFESWALWAWWGSTLFRLLPRARRLSRYFRQMKVSLDVSIQTVQVFFISMVVFMTAHWVGCAFFFTARLRYADDTTWLSNMELLLPLYDSHQSPIGVQYVICLYNGFSLLTSLGYSMFKPNNTGEILLTFFVIAAQVLQTSVILSRSFIYMKSDAVEEAHKKRMEDLHTFLDSKEIPPDLRGRIVKHFEFQYQKAIENKSSRVDLGLPRSLELKVANFKYRSVISGFKARGQIFAGALAYHACMCITAYVCATVCVIETRPS